MKQISAIFAIILLITACNQKHKTRECVNEIVHFVENQKDSCPNYTDADWDKANLEFLNLLKEANKYNRELTSIQKIQITKASTSYVLLQKYRNIEFLINMQSDQTYE